MKDDCYKEQREPSRLAMAYVLWQHFDGIFEDLEEAFQTGTIFPELDLPFTGRRCVS